MYICVILHYSDSYTMFFYVNFFVMSQYEHNY
jgi:hypothetical protein